MKVFTVVVLATAAIALASSTARADTITLADWTTGHFAANADGGGGPFRAATTGGALGDAELLTFCLEYNEHFGYGRPYYFTMSNAANGGGVSGGNPDYLSDATRWLFYQAVTGGYSSWYAGVTGLALDDRVGAAFQYAVWLLEGERTASQIGGTGSAGYLMAQYALGQDWSGLYAQGHRVYVLNLTTMNGGPAQDQLAYAAPVPEPGSLLLFGSGLAGGLRAWRRRRG